MQSTKRALSVSQLNRKAKGLLEDEFQSVDVEGEVSNFSVPSSGHWYFSIKDASAQVDCVMFRGNNLHVKFEPKIGAKIYVTARVSLYEPRGGFQLIVSKVKQAGIGDLQIKFEELKAKLDKEGLFDQERKKQIPTDPSTIAVITSLKGAALQDVLKALKRRAPTIRVYVLPATVQGPNGSKEIIQALKLADQYKERYHFDLVLLTRGGGSPEDMWNFNEEAVVRAIARCQLPIINAVGHQIDFTLADFVADMRAPTPSTAAEELSPDNEERLQALAKYSRDLASLMQRHLKQCQIQVQHRLERLRHPRSYIQQQSQSADRLQERMERAIKAKLLQNADKPSYYKRRLQRSCKHVIQRYDTRVKQIGSTFELVNPLNVLKRGYSVLRDKNRNVLHSTKQVQVGQTVQAQLAEGELVCEVQNTHHSHTSKA